MDSSNATTTPYDRRNNITGQYKIHRIFHTNVIYMLQTHSKPGWWAVFGQSTGIISTPAVTNQIQWHLTRSPNLKHDTRNPAPLNLPTGSPSHITDPVKIVINIPPATCQLTMNVTEPIGHTGMGMTVAQHTSSWNSRHPGQHGFNGYRLVLTLHRFS